MTLNAWIGVLIVVVPALTLLGIAGAVRICLMVIADEEPAASARAGSASARAPFLQRSGAGRARQRAQTPH
jgi:hypothetical protein